MRFVRLLLLPVVLCLANPAHAEKLVFDHRLYPPLRQVLDSGASDKVLYDASNPKYVIDRIIVRGETAREWTEQVEIIARTPGRGMRTADDWAAELQRRADRACPNRITEVARDANALTLERRSEPCPAEAAPFAVYRIVAGKRSLFLLAVISKVALAEAQRREWLALLASARIE
jgi:hypothetical protein